MTTALHVADRGPPAFQAEGSMMGAARVPMNSRKGLPRIG